MIYLLYVLVAVGVMFFSIKASKYVDMIDKSTNLSGAFIGGVMLSAVTSLPELFTSISSTILLDNPGLCMGNILGSNLFNLAVLTILVLIAFKPFSKAKVSNSHMKVTLFIALVYIVIALNMAKILDFEMLTISITSVVILLLYIRSVKHMSNEDSETSVDDGIIINLTLKQIIVRFIAVSLGIVVLSIIITYITDIISVKLNLGAGLAGAIFLGVATSLPEVSSTIALFKMKNYDIAVGNIIGSNIFNFLIFTIVDLIYVGKGIYDFTDPQTINLLVFGFAATVLAFLLLKFRNKTMQVVCSLGVICCYVLFLTV